MNPLSLSVSLPHHRQPNLHVQPQIQQNAYELKRESNSSQSVVNLYSNSWSYSMLTSLSTLCTTPIRWIFIIVLLLSSNLFPVSITRLSPSFNFHHSLSILDYELIALGTHRLLHYIIRNINYSLPLLCAVFFFFIPYIYMGNLQEAYLGSNIQGKSFKINTLLKSWIRTEKAVCTS